MGSSRSETPARKPPIAPEHVAAIAAAVVVAMGPGWSVVSVEPAPRAGHLRNARVRHSHDPKRPDQGWRGRT